MDGGIPARDSLIRIIAKPKTGRERFSAGEQMLDFELSDFWRWSTFDLVSNTSEPKNVCHFATEVR